MQQQLTELQQQLTDVRTQLHDSDESLVAARQALRVAEESCTLEHDRTTCLKIKLEAAGIEEETMLSTLASVSNEDHTRAAGEQLESSSVMEPTAEKPEGAVASSSCVEEDVLSPLDVGRRGPGKSSSSLASPRPKRNSSSEQLVLKSL